MSRKTIKLLGLFVALTMLFSISAIGCGKTNEPASVEETPKPVTISYLTWRAEDDAVWKQVISEFEKENSNIKVKIEYSKDNTLHYQTLQANLVTGDNIDVFDVHPNDKYIKYIDEGFMVDLSNETFVKDLTDGAKALTTYKDKVWGFVGVQNLIGCIYNKEIFAKYGFDVPKDYADFVNIVTTMKSKGEGGVAYLGKDVGIDWLFNCLYNEGYGADAFKAFKEKIDSGDLTNVKEDAGAYEVLKQFADLNKNKILYDNSASVGYPQSISLFAQKKAPIVMMGTWTFGTAENDYPGIDFGYFPFPSSVKAGMGYGEPGQISCVAAKSKNIEASKKFVNFLAQRNDIYTEGTKMMTTMKTVKNTFKGADVLMAQMDKGVTMIPVPITPNSDSWGNAFGDAGKNILFKGADVDKEIANFEAFLKKADLKNKK